MVSCNLRSDEMNVKTPSALPALRRFQLAIAGFLARVILYFSGKSSFEAIEKITEKREPRCQIEHSGMLSDLEYWREETDPDGYRFKYLYANQEYSSHCNACARGTCVQKVMRYEEDFGCVVVHDCLEELN